MLFSVKFALRPKMFAKQFNKIKKSIQQLLQQTPMLSFCDFYTKVIILIIRNLLTCAFTLYVAIKY